MSKTMEQEFEEATKYTITDDDIERARKLVGVDLADRGQEHFATATPDSIRNFAMSLGDDNPLFVTEDYGKYTRWGSQIAPNIMAGILNKPMLGDPPSAEVKENSKSLFKGIHVFVSGGEWKWYRPVYPGDTIYSFGGQDGVEVKASEFAGRSVTRFRRHVKINQRGEVVGAYRVRTILTERKTAKTKGKYADIQPASYTDEDLERIDEVYANEKVRGGEPRYWEDTNVGDKMGKMVKGPLTVTDIIVFHSGGYGFVPYGLRSGRHYHNNRKRISAFYIKNEYGIPDVAQRVHWDSSWAQAIGNPMAYDYGVMRETWLHHFLTDWAGDDAFICRQYDEIRKFNYIGDTQFITGQVVDKRREGNRCYVDVVLHMINQRDTQTVMGEASILLPSRENGPVVLPQVPEDIEQRAALMFGRHGQLLKDRPGK